MKNEQNVNYQAPPQGQNNHQEPPQGQNNYQATPQGQNIPQPPPPRPQGQPVTIFARPKTKNKFLTFCFSLLPGAGQMYHGLYKRGMFIMIAFWGIIAFAMTLYLPAITFLLPVIWFYSFFEAVNRMNMPIEEIELLKDTFPLQSTFSKDKGIFSFITEKRAFWIGSGFLGVGIYAFGTSLFSILSAYVDSQMYWALRGMWRNIPAILVPLLCIILGIKLIGGRVSSHTQDTIVKTEPVYKDDTKE